MLSFTDWAAGPVSEADRKRAYELHQQGREADRTAAGKLHRVRNFRAVTPAGIYAKALVVRQSKTGANDLARSLAKDLVPNAPLRALLGPNVRTAYHEHHTRRP
jgi:hypothetical protein